ncbi:hypothetical protein [Succinimonas sp.]|uniref:hypothetical protein n=1 Tax=Succinimonas sp. TaxID=1936151 RepID=UPI0038631BDA
MISGERNAERPEPKLPETALFRRWFILFRRKVAVKIVEYGHVPETLRDFDIRILFTQVYRHIKLIFPTVFAMLLKPPIDADFRGVAITEEGLRREVPQIRFAGQGKIFFCNAPFFQRIILFLSDFSRGFRACF